MFTQYLSSRCSRKRSRDMGDIGSGEGCARRCPSMILSTPLCAASSVTRVPKNAPVILSVQCVAGSTRRAPLVRTRRNKSTSTQRAAGYTALVSSRMPLASSVPPSDLTRLRRLANAIATRRNFDISKASPNEHRAPHYLFGSHD